MADKIIIGSRESRLAVIQSETLLSYIEKECPGKEGILLTMKTTGDKILDRTLDKVGGKGLFVKELDRALMNHESDVSVHSLKDVPMEISEELPLVAFSARADVRDVLVLPKGKTEIDPALPIGCSSERRVLQAKKLFPGMEFKPVRGNVITRLAKLDAGEYSALILAAAGLKRLGLSDRISRSFTTDEILPAAGQAIMAVQARADEDITWLSGYDNRESRLCAIAERSVVRTLDGGCSSPIAAYGEMKDQTMTLRGLYAKAGEGSYCISEKSCELPEDLKEAENAVEKLGYELGFDLLKKHASVGKVWLVGAGPGDVGLFTLKGKQVLKQADVVVYDRLVGHGILAMIPETAKIIDVGKKAGNHTMPQWQINRVLSLEALKGRKVVRLKGGDPFLFGRGGEELEQLIADGVPYEVVPGVTSPISVPAYNGIPVTHRDFCSSVHIITGHKRQGASYDIDFEALVRTKGTLVFLMGVTALPDIMKGLMDGGMDPAMPAAILQKGTTARQKRIIATVATLEAEVLRQGIETPAIIVVGKVCALADTFAWVEKLPLAGKRFVVTRPKNRSGKLVTELRTRGAEVIELPCIKTVSHASEELKDAIRNLSAYDRLVFTSATGVECFFDAMRTSGNDIRSLFGKKLSCVGPGTANALLEKGLLSEKLPGVYDGANLGALLAACCEPGENILIARAEFGGNELTDALARRADLSVTDLTVYTTEYTSGVVHDLTEEVRKGDVDGVMFTSASTVKGFAACFAGCDLSGLTALCIGEKTADAARSYQMNVKVAKKATVDNLIALACDLSERS